MPFDCMNVILFYSDNRNVSTTNVTILRVVCARIQIYLVCREWPKHVGDRYVIKLHS